MRTMKTLAVVSQKGGTGKTTLALSLAVAAASDGLSVLAMDLDPQASLRAWWRARAAPTPDMLQADPNPHAVRGAVKGLVGRYDLCVLDTPGSVTPWLSEALCVCDLALVPVQTSQFDLAAVGQTLAALRAAGTPWAFVMNRAIPRTVLTQETRRALAAHGRVAPCDLHQRVAHMEAGADGRSAAETSDRKAADEIRQTWDYVRTIL